VEGRGREEDAEKATLEGPFITSSMLYQKGLGSDAILFCFILVILVTFLNSNAIQFINQQVI